MTMFQIECHAHQDGDSKHNQLHGNLFNPRDWQPGKPEQNQQTHTTDDRNLGIHVAESTWQSGQQSERTNAFRSSDSNHFVGLLRDDDHTNRRQHAMDRSQWKKLGQSSAAKRADQNLQNTGSESNSQCKSIAKERSIGIGQIRTELRPQLHDRAGHDHNQSRRRAFDGQL